MWGSGSSMMGLEGLPIVTSPLAGSLEDLHEFSKRVILAKPWQYDHTVRPPQFNFFGVAFSFLKKITCNEVCSFALAIRQPSRRGSQAEMGSYLGRW